MPWACHPNTLRVRHESHRRLTHSVTGLENYAELFATFGQSKAAIKVVGEVADAGTAA